MADVYIRRSPIYVNMRVSEGVKATPAIALTRTIAVDPRVFSADVRKKDKH